MFKRREKIMRTVWIAAAAAGLMGVAGTSFAQMDQGLAVPGAQVARDVPGAHELPDPSRTYKIVFDVAAPAESIDQVNPMLAAMARYVNTLAKYGVPAEHRQIAAVFHGGTTDLIMNNEAYKARNDGHDNPNIALIQNLKKAGVDFRVCGQAVLGRKIDPKTIQPEIQLDLWALTTFMNLQQQGYVKVGGGS
jgi:intracellular sulfur oxidation DsrE/DsrF family protein